MPSNLPITLTRIDASGYQKVIGRSEGMMLGDLLEELLMADGYSIAALVVLGTGLLCGGCYGCQQSHLGYESIDNAAIAQPKKVFHERPLVFCEDYVDVDLSLGVMVNGTGSYSSQDEMFQVPNKSVEITLDDAISQGKLVRVHYNSQRFNVCRPTNEITSVEVLDKDSK